MEELSSAPVAVVILALTVLASIYVFQKPYEARKWMLNPYEFYYRRRYYTLLTSGFIHADWQHLIFNAFSFYFFAFTLESFMVSAAGANGHLYFGLIYLLSMLLGSIPTVIRHRKDPGYFSLGASGAISGLIFSFILFAPTSTLGFFFIPLPAPLFAVLYIILSIYASRQKQGNVNHDAHLWGAVSGLVLTVIFFPGIHTNFLSQIGYWLGHFTGR